MFVYMLYSLPGAPIELKEIAINIAVLVVIGLVVVIVRWFLDRKK
jgi:uncharacterized membrane-anchored protein